jgi:hypothetical protein
VALIIFNRPHTTRAVFERIRAARPPKLLVTADGPRRGRPEEEQLCAAARQIVNEVDWPCEVHTHFSDVNLGCRNGVASGIDWVFSLVSEAIILEDDCLPHPSFFRFCAELLQRYRDDPRVGSIAGSNVHAGPATDGPSYFFSKYPVIWGWATWRRAWAHYDRSASTWPRFRRSAAFRAITLPAERAHWERTFDSVHSGGFDTWDYQWVLTCWRTGMLTTVPHCNLISNIGFGPGATHTVGIGAHASLPCTEMPFPLLHPHEFQADRKADAVRAAGFKLGWRGRLLRTVGLSGLSRLYASYRTARLKARSASPPPAVG